MSQHSKKEEGQKRSKYYESRYDHYILAKQFKQKNPTIDKLKQI
jgi:hypothetical protein